MPHKDPERRREYERNRYRDMSLEDKKRHWERNKICRAKKPEHYENLRKTWCEKNRERIRFIKWLYDQKEYIQRAATKKRYRDNNKALLNIKHIKYYFENKHFISVQNRIKYKYGISISLQEIRDKYDEMVELLTIAL